MSAVTALFDRGWGKAPQPHAGEDGKDIRITIQQIVEGGHELRAAKSECLVVCAGQRMNQEG